MHSPKHTATGVAQRAVYPRSPVAGEAGNDCVDIVLGCWGTAGPAVERGAVAAVASAESGGVAAVASVDVRGANVRSLPK